MNGPILLEEVPPPGPWSQDGTCRAVPTPVFFPGRGGSTGPAKEVCRRCPVRAECQEYALALPQLKGVWAGLSESERRRLRAGRAASAPAPVPRDPNARVRAPRARKRPLYRALEELSASPGRWARVAWYPAPGTAQSMVARLQDGRVDVPGGRWQFSGAPAEGGSGLWARYEGDSAEGSAEVAV